MDNPNQSASKLFAVLEFLVEHGPISLKELSTALQFNKSTTHRLLKSLMVMGYVKQHPQTQHYEATFKVVHLSDCLIKQSDIVRLMHPFLQELAQQSGETVHLVKQEEMKIVYIDKVESLDKTVRMVSCVGRSHSMFTTAVGKMILAQKPCQLVQQWWEQHQPEPLTPYTLLTWKDFLEEIQRVKKQGFAVDDQENELGVRCIAGGIVDHNGEMLYAFSISAPAQRMSPERLVYLIPIVKKYADMMSKQYGQGSWR